MIEWLSWVKLIHIGAALVSITGFIVRGAWMLAGSPRLKRRWVRIIPHVVDTVLLGAGIWLMVATAQYPTDHPWLAAKLAALLAYILLGMVALRWAHTRAVRAAAFFAAIAVFAYIAAAALTRNPTLG
jgi:uncharacterized membrane protein SirB2